MKRSIHAVSLAVASVAVMSLALAGCSSGTSGGTPSGSPAGALVPKDDGAKLTLWVRPGNEAVTDKVVDAYNSTHKNQVAITHVPADQFVTKYAAASQTNSLPDLLASDIIFMPQIVKNGSVVDLTQLLKTSGAYGHLDPSHEEVSTSNGRVYGVPYVADTSLYLYNKELFKQAGLDPNSPPTTWAGIIKDADAITALGNGISGFYMSTGPLGYDFTPLIWAQGQQVVKKDGSFDLDNKATQNALTFMHTLYKNGDIPEAAKTDAGDGFFSVFASGKIGIDFAGGNGVNTSTIGTNPKFDFGLAGIPGPKAGETATFSGGDVAAITKSSKHMDEAADFITWLTSKATSQNVYLKLPALPPRTDVDAPASLGDQFTVPATLVKKGQIFVTIYYNQVIATAQGPFDAMFQSAVFGGVDPVTATKTAQAAADAITNSK